MATETKRSTATDKGTAAGASAIAPRLARLRELSDAEPSAAAEETWAWFVEAGRRIQTDRDPALAELNELFRSGAPSTGIEGPTRGTLVGFTMTPLADRALAGITAAWLPWAGKRFDAAAARGDNLLLRSARLPSKLPWPLYRMRDAGEHLAAFDFETRVEAGALDPDRQVLVIDYAPVDSNPALIIKQIRDELVEVVPGAHLGKMLWRTRGGDHALLAYFALRSSL